MNEPALTLEPPPLPTRGKPLTKRQEICLDFIKRYLVEKGFAPSLREIGAHMGIRSTNGVNDQVLALQRRGFIRIPGNTARGIVVIAPERDEANASPFLVEMDRIRAENEALRRLLERTLNAVNRQFMPSVELIVVMADVREALGLRRAG